MKCAGRLAYIGILVCITISAQPQTIEKGKINFDSLRIKYRDLMIGGAYSLKDPDIRAKVGSIGRNGLTIWKSMISDTSNSKALWTDLKYNRSSDITNSYKRLQAMAIAYASPGTIIYQDKRLRNDIIRALDWLYIHQYNEHTVIPKSGGRNNWWDYRIGSPERLNTIMIVMYDQLSPFQRANYVKAINHSTPDAAQYTGANLLWVSKVIGLSGIVEGNAGKLRYARDAIKPVFDEVTAGDGFYKDGSFIQHQKHAYTGGYGTALLGAVADMMYIFPAIQQLPSGRRVYDWIYHSYAPLLYNGGMMSMVMGREISRENYSEHKKGRTVIEVIALLANQASPEEALRLKGIIKANMLADKTSKSYYASLSSITMIQMIKGIMNDPLVKPRNDYYHYQQFSNMDRAVHQAVKYAFAISMHSSRTYNFESINEENGKAWHTADGMTYLYNADQQQFEDNFWATVNYSRLPGTTVEEGERPPRHNQVSTRDWVGGGVINGRYGISGMELGPAQSTLSGKKSWFMFDNEIVALGTGIGSQAQKNVVTTIEQRKLNVNNSNVFTVNGRVLPAVLNATKYPDIQWAHLGAETPEAAIGYYFPIRTTVHIERKAQSGKWSDINAVGSQKVHTRNFLTLWNDHGNHPAEMAAAQGSYAYVLLPGFSLAKVQQYNSDPDIRILANTDAVQAVQDKRLNLTGANFWKDSLATVSLAAGQPFLNCSGKAAVLVLEEHGQLKVAVSDPTMKNEGTIDLEINHPALRCLIKDPEVTVMQLTPVIRISIAVKNLRGKSVSSTFNIK